MADDTQETLAALLGEDAGIDWSVALRSGDGSVIASVGADRALSTASVGKLLLLVEIACQYENGSLDGSELLEKLPALAVADSGIWQHLRVAALSIDDLAVLVGSVSDNLATNVLLERVGLTAVQERAASMNLKQTRLLDRVRDHRGVGDPPHLSEGSAHELSWMMAQLASGTLVSRRVSEHLDRWLAPGADLSMVAAPFLLDPLAHVDEDRRLVLRNKTGTNTGVRADVGTLRGPVGNVSYAVVANWDAGLEGQRALVLQTMHDVGRLVLELVS